MIFCIEDTAVEKIVSELGYANVSMGMAGVLSLISQTWAAPAGVAGGLFLGQHCAKRERNVAMATDLLVSFVVAVYLGLLAVR